MKNKIFRKVGIAAVLMLCLSGWLSGCAGTHEHASEETAGVSAAAGTTHAHRFDRLGRMEITNTYLRNHKGAYNQEDTFAIPPERLEVYSRALDPHLKDFDRMDGVDDWTPDGGPHPMTRPLLQDYLLVDVSKPCEVSSRSYLDLEKAVLRGTEATTCGGRVPNDQALDVMLTLMVNGPDRDEPWRSDGVEKATKPSTNQFPYLAPPNP